MTVAVSKAVEAGAKAIICASTGNTSASAAAYAARAGITCAVLVPQGKIALGKLAQALVHGARLLQVSGNFDDCLALASKLAQDYPVALVNSVNIDRLHGQKTAAFEIVEALGDAPDIHCLPVGNAGNISAYWMGYSEELRGRQRHPAPRRCTASRPPARRPIVTGQVVPEPSTIATAIRIGNPASWTKAVDARDASGGLIAAVTDREILVGVPAAGPRGGRLRRAGQRGQRGRPAPAGRGRARCRAGSTRGLHGHRPRPEGPGVGDLHRARRR